jgi:hypothetical protein
MGFLQKLGARGRGGDKRADEIRKQISEDYPDSWLRPFEFLVLESRELVRDHIIRAIGKSSPQRVLVVGGVDLFESLRASDLPAYSICVNTVDDLGWLCEFCKYARSSQAPSMVVGNFPRRHSPPTVRFAVGPNYIAKVGMPGAGGLRPYETVAPQGASVALCEEGDQRTGISVFFCHVHALSYYDEVLRSQHRRADQLLTCAVLTTPDDSGVLIDEQERLKASADLAERRQILIQASEGLEFFCRFYSGDDRCTETPAYSGGVLAHFTAPERVPSRPSP